MNRTQILPFVSSLFLGAGLAFAQATAPAPVVERAPGLEAIDQKDLSAHAAWFAANERMGRLTGTPGQREVAQYIAKHFESLGLEPLGDLQADGKRSWFQHYGVTITALTEASAMKFGALEVKSGYAAVAGKPVDFSVSGKVRFVGLGRTRGAQAEVGEGVDLAGAVAVALVPPPRGSIDRQLGIEQKFGMSFAALQGLPRTAKALEAKGASAVVFLLVKDTVGMSDVLNYLALSPGKPSVRQRFKTGMDEMAMMAGALSGAKSPMVVLAESTSAALLAELGVGKEQVEAYLESREAQQLPAGKDGLEGSVRIEVTVDKEATAENVVAVLRGSDAALGSEALVYSAHMDHVGMRMDGEVFNGADDNASGSAGMLEIAQAFATAKEKPRRSVIFLSVSGEELGLWGSEFYSDNPTWPLESIVANINTDMIGRSGPESGEKEVTVTPSNRHEMFSTLVQRSAVLADEFGMTFSSGDKYYSRSDHYNFARKGIPVVFFCNGEHEDYHQVTDHPEKLDVPKMERIARLAYWTGWATANDDERPRKLGKQAEWK